MISFSFPRKRRKRKLVSRARTEVSAKSRPHPQGLLGVQLIPVTCPPRGRDITIKLAIASPSLFWIKSKSPTYRYWRHVNCCLPDGLLRAVVLNAWNPCLYIPTRALLLDETHVVGKIGRRVSANVPHPI